MVWRNIREGEIILEGKFSTEYLATDELKTIGLSDIKKQSFNTGRIGSDDLETEDFVFLTSITIGLRNERKRTNANKRRTETTRRKNPTHKNKTKK